MSTNIYSGPWCSVKLMGLNTQLGAPWGLSLRAPMGLGVRG